MFVYSLFYDWGLSYVRIALAKGNEDYTYTKYFQADLLCSSSEGGSYKYTLLRHNRGTAQTKEWHKGSGGNGPSSAAANVMSHDSISPEGAPS
jgi:hypothetical protein